jgi:hypothetical protein
MAYRLLRMRPMLATVPVKRGSCASTVSPEGGHVWRLSPLYPTIGCVLQVRTR